MAQDSEKRSLRERMWEHRALLATIAIAELVALIMVSTIDEHNHIDGEVYQLGAKAWLAGRDLYENLPATESGLNLPFIYPPFAAVLFTPLALVPKSVAIVAIMVLTHLSLLVTLYLVLSTSTFLQGYRDKVLVATAAALPLTTVIEPVQETIGYSQINVMLMALVAIDCLWRTDGQRGLPYPRGLLIGIAIGIKLTPAGFLLFFLLRKDFRAIATALASFLGTIAVGFGFLFADARDYWLGGQVFSNSEVSFGPQFEGDPSTWGGNQCLRALLGKAGMTDPWLNAVLIPLILTVLALAVVGMIHAFRQRDLPMAMVINGVLKLLLSPISWSNHWVWAAPGLVLLAGLAYARRNWPLLMATAMATGLFIMRPHWLLPQGDGIELRWTFFQELVGSTYVYLGLAFLVYVASRWWRARSDRPVTSNQPRQESPTPVG